MAIIKTKIPFDGYRANLLFVKGVAETDNEHLIEWFKSHGYTVDEKLNKEKYEELKRFEKMSVEKIREYLKEHGLGVKMGSLKNKTKLLEMVKEVI